MDIELKMVPVKDVFDGYKDKGDDNGVVGYHARASKITCAVFSIFFFCSSVGDTHGKLL